MATSGTYTTTLTVIEAIDEAFERIDRDPADLQQRHLTGARRSLNILLRSWARYKTAQYRIEQREEPILANTETYNLPAGGIDILDAVVRNSDNQDLALQIISKSEYLYLPDKTQTSDRPVQLFVDRQEQPTVTLWPKPDAAGDTLVYNYIRTVQNATTFGEDVDIVMLWEEALHAGLAMKLAEKYNNDLFKMKKSLYGEALENALIMERDTSDTVIGLGGR